MLCLISLQLKKNLQSKYQSEFVFVDNDNKPLKYINVHMALSNLVKKINSTLQRFEGRKVIVYYPACHYALFSSVYFCQCALKKIFILDCTTISRTFRYQITMDTYSHVSDEKRWGRNENSIKINQKFSMV